MYRAILNAREVREFCEDFFNLESARMTKVEITPDERYVSFKVVLVPQGEPGVSTLQKSFKDGSLSRGSWHKKFKNL